MDPAYQQRLNELNLSFYETHAENFADTRPRLNPGVKQILSSVPAGARVLELGCGDGKVARWLAAHAPPAFYLGLDSSAGMLARARRYTEALPAARSGPPLEFGQADLTAADWAAGRVVEPIDWVFAFAVLHHLPGYATRARLLTQIARWLRPGSRCAISNWQFTRSARLRRHSVPWSEIGLSPAALEPGDYLLSWERGGRHGLRYVHLIDQAEVQRLAEQAGLRVTDIFNADGHGGNLALYSVLKK